MQETIGCAARRLRSRGDPCDRARGRAFRGCSRADTGAMDSVGGHAAGADKPGVGASGADIPGVQALLRALETARPARIVWIGGIPPGGPMTCPLNRAARSRLAPMSHQAGIARWPAARPWPDRGAAPSNGRHRRHGVDRRPAVAGMAANAASPNCARTCMAVCNRRSRPGPRDRSLAPGPPAVARRSRAIGVRVPVGRGPQHLAFATGRSRLALCGRRVGCGDGARRAP